MKHILHLITFIFPIALTAQPILTYENCSPTAGLTFETLELDGMSNSLPGASGVNVIWDFSTVPFIGNPAVLYQYKQPWNSVYYSNHLESNLMKSTSQGDHFYISTPDSLVYSGSHGSNFYSYSSDRKLLLPFPITYQNTFNDTLICWGDSGPDNYTSINSSELQADGYGTLILPTGVTLTDVLRIKITEYEIYVVDVSNYTAETNRTTFKWYKPGIKDPVLEYTKWITSGWSEYRKVIVQSASSVLGLNNMEIQQSLVYPNPIITSGKINFPDTGLGRDLRIYDSSGLLVLEENGINQNEWILESSDFKSGMYFYMLSDETGLLSKGKFIFQ